MDVLQILGYEACFIIIFIYCVLNIKYTLCDLFEHVLYIKNIYFVSQVNLWVGYYEQR